MGSCLWNISKKRISRTRLLKEEFGNAAISPEYIQLCKVKMPRVFLFLLFLLGYKTSEIMIPTKKSYFQVLSDHHISNTFHIILIMVRLQSIYKCRGKSSR